MDKNKLKGIAERKLDHMRHGCFRGGLNYFLETGTINGTFLDALNELVTECVGEKPDASENTLPIDIVMLSFADFEKISIWIKDNDYVFYSGKTSSWWETSEGMSVCKTTKELIDMFHKANEA